MIINNIPTYSARPYSVPETGERVPYVFGVYEMRDGRESFSFKLDNRGDRYQELMKRGIPEDQAWRMFYQMDGI